jgi:hypothetical protein
MNTAACFVSDDTNAGDRARLLEDSTTGSSMVKTPATCWSTGGVVGVLVGDVPGAV